MAIIRSDIDNIDGLLRTSSHCLSSCLVCSYEAHQISTSDNWDPMTPQKQPLQSCMLILFYKNNNCTTQQSKHLPSCTLTWYWQQLPHQQNIITSIYRQY